MAPTKADLITQLKNAAKALEIDWLHASQNADNVLAQEDVIIQALEMTSGNAAAELSALTSRRAAMNAMIQQGAVRAILDPVIIEWGKLLNVPETDPDTILRPRMSDQFIVDGDSVKDRDITRGAAVAGGSNVGDGSLLRNTTDADSEPIESSYVEIKTFEITPFAGQDANTGATRNREVFSVLGGDKAPDELERTGSGVDTTIRLVEASESIVVNAGFDLYTGTIGSPTGIPSWTSSVTVDSSNYEFSETDIYQPKPNANVTRLSLNIKAMAAALTQRLDLRSGSILPETPYIVQIAFNRSVGSADGTLTLALGTASASVAMAAQSGWQVLRLPIGADSWLKNFNEDELDVSISRTSGTTGELLIDDLICVPMTFIDEGLGGGSWWAMVGGETPFLTGDVFTVTDTFASSDSVIQKWLWRGYGTSGYLPSSSTPTISDP